MTRAIQKYGYEIDILHTDALCNYSFTDTLNLSRSSAEAIISGKFSHKEIMQLYF